MTVLKAGSGLMQGQGALGVLPGIPHTKLVRFVELVREAGEHTISLIHLNGKSFWVFSWTAVMLGIRIEVSKTDNGVLPMHIEEYRLSAVGWRVTFRWDRSGSSTNPRVGPKKRFEAFGGWGVVDDLRVINEDAFKDFWMLVELGATLETEAVSCKGRGV